MPADPREQEKSSGKDAAPRRAWIIFAIGLAPWPLYWAGEALCKVGYLKSRQLLDHTEAVAVIGFLCCVIAPFSAAITLKRKILFSFVAALVYIIEVYLLMLIFIAIFGPPKD